MNEAGRKSPNSDLFNPATQERIRRATSPGMKWVFFGAAVLVGLIVGGLHYEEPFLPYWLSICPQELPRYDCEYPARLDILAGLASFMLFGAFAWMLFRLRRIPPTVRCEQCGARGWIEDLESTGGRCPRCAHDRFAYFALEPTSVPAVRVWRLRDTSGQDLLAHKAVHSHLL